MRFLLRSPQILVLYCLTYLCGCGAPPRQDPSMRDQLRTRADQASDFDYQKPLGRPKTQRVKTGDDASSSSASSPRVERVETSGEKSAEGVACDAPSARYLVAEGSGTTRQEAESDASTRLTAQIKSEVQSVTQLQITDTETTGQIKRIVKTHFSRGELIKYLPIRHVGEAIATCAYLDRDHYHEMVIEEITFKLDSLRELLGATKGLSSGERFVRLWNDLEREVTEFQPIRSEYRAIMGRDIEGMSELVASLRELNQRASKLRQSARFVLEVEGLKVAGPSTITLLKEAIQVSGVRVRSPATCLEGHHLILVEGGVSHAVNKVTGGDMMELQWQATLYRCGRSDQERTELSQVALPSIKGIERYQSSAEQVIHKRLKTLLKLVKERTPPSEDSPLHSAPTQAQRLTDSLVGLVGIVVPVSK